MSEETKKTTARTKSRNKEDSALSGKYTNMVQSLLDIWNVLAASKQPLSAGEIGKRLKERSTSAQTAERRMSDSMNVLNNLYPHTVICQEGSPSGLMTYSHGESLHVVLEHPTGEPFWEGNMTAILCESPLNPIPQPTLNRKLPELMNEYGGMVERGTADQEKQTEEDKKKDPRREEKVTYTDKCPPISLAGVVATKGIGGKTTYIPCSKWEERHLEEIQKERAALKKKKNGKEDGMTAEEKKHSPTRRYYLQSILSPEEWQLLSDLILVYPYISEAETKKLLSAMQRLAPGCRDWTHLIHAKKTPNAVQFQHIRKLEDCIQSQCLTTIKYGRYQLTHHLSGWKPTLLPDTSLGNCLVEPSALMWSNGYYYLVCRIQRKDDNGNIWWERRNLRVDRILDVIPTRQTFEKDETFDPFEYRDQSPVMYPGEVVPIELLCHTSMLSTLMDFFGTDTLEYTAPNNDYTKVSLEATEAGTRLFVLQYADRVEILSPPSLRNEVKNTLQTAVKKYK